MHWLAVTEAGLPPGQAWLSPDESVRLERLRFTKPRTEYLLRRWAGKRAVLALEAAAPARLDPAELARVELLNRPGGAPFVRREGVLADLDVSLTDRAGVAVGLVGPAGRGTLGTDLELVEPRSAAFVADYLTPAERDAVAASGGVSSEPWNLAANLVWSAKESALKVLRVGLRADTRSVVVSWGAPPGPDGWAPLSVGTQDGWTFPGWWRRDGQFVLTVVYREAALPPVLLPGGDDLAVAVPTHSWLASPVVDAALDDEAGPTEPTRAH
ncbi:MAG: 4'-phosphopantetheinyl transferase superfamily protein [Dermatophilaceae bacterium]